MVNVMDNRPILQLLHVVQSYWPHSVLKDGSVDKGSLGGASHLLEHSDCFRDGHRTQAGLITMQKLCWLHSVAGTLC